MTLLSMTRGDTAVFDVALTDGAGDPLDITDATLTFTVKRRLSDPDSAAVVQKTTGNGITHGADPTDGTATITLDPDDTADLSTIGSSLLWDVQVTGAADDVHTPLSGRLAIAPDVTRPAPP
jgi:hypothetical protein